MEPVGRIAIAHAHLTSRRDGLRRSTIAEGDIQTDDPNRARCARTLLAIAASDPWAPMEPAWRMAIAHADLTSRWEDLRRSTIAEGDIQFVDTL